MGPAHFAAMGGSAAILKELCDAGANVNQSPYEVSSVLQFAVQLYEYDTNEAISMTEVLCLPPQDVSLARTPKSPPARLCALSLSRWCFVSSRLIVWATSYCINTGQHTPSRTRLSESTADTTLFMYWSCGRGGFFCSVHRSQRSKVTARDVLGSALNFGCGRGMTPIVERLLQANADPNYFPNHDDFAFTPLIGLIYENESHPGHPIIAQLLLDAGADPRHIGRSATALGYAEDYDRRDLIPILRAAEERAANEPE